MRSKGSCFTLGVWGLRVCSLDVAFTTATARSRSQPSAWGPYGRAYGKLCTRGHFWRFQMSCSPVSRGRCGISWHSDVFRNVWKIVLWQAQYMRCFFRGRRNTFDVTVFVSRGRRSTLDVSCGSFCSNRILRAAWSGDKVQIPWQAWHFVRCAEFWRKPCTK